MSVHGIETYHYTPAAVQTKSAVETDKKGTEVQQEKAVDSNVTSRPKTDEVIISKPKTEKTDREALVQRLKDDNERRINEFKTLIRSMVVKQGETSNLTLFGMQLNVSPEESAKAQAAISDGGEYSVDSVAGRILDMAKALTGGDKSKISTMRDAFKKGFDQAKDAFGGTLPDISNKTYDEVMKRFDAWEKEGSTEDTAAVNTVEA